ncbi:hypothetical protein ACFV83_34770 [Streptomyces pharetrae]|uniref:hypothetical protein n=1 Tax=Streptomyces pharetrae TaxID=291370 RepID=UPI003662680B
MHVSRPAARAPLLQRPALRRDVQCMLDASAAPAVTFPSALSEALDDPDGERLYAVRLHEARRRQAEREAAHREAQRLYALRHQGHRRALAGDQAVLVARRVGPVVRAVCPAGRRPGGG